ncbi:MAG: hypothetical protein KatS3mg056_0608 [Chloroflexus sp.]|nr:MAG: hypothetical protein KatS3mg056_0608 [Chloroflexus sp.]
MLQYATPVLSIRYVYLRSSGFTLFVFTVSGLQNHYIRVYLLAA